MIDKIGEGKVRRRQVFYKPRSIASLLSTCHGISFMQRRASPRVPSFDQFSNNIYLQDERGRPIQLTDKHGIPVELNDEYGNPMRVTGVATNGDTKSSDMFGGGIAAGLSGGTSAGNIGLGGKNTAPQAVRLHRSSSSSSSSSEDDEESGRIRKKGLIATILKKQLGGGKHKDEEEHTTTILITSVERSGSAVAVEHEDEKKGVVNKIDQGEAPCPRP